MSRTAAEIISLILLGALSRLVPHLPNMTAIGAIALKSRAHFGSAGLLIPLSAMLLSDAAIGFYDWKLLLSVYASFALIGFLGVFLKRTSVPRVVAVASLGSILFFLITNTLVWAASLWYPHTAAGLLACLAAGLPFLYPMLAGDIVFSLALFRFRAAAHAPLLRRTAVISSSRP
jgi:hypothetical protein